MLFVKRAMQYGIILKYGLSIRFHGRKLANLLSGITTYLRKSAAETLMLSCTLHSKSEHLLCISYYILGVHIQVEPPIRICPIHYNLPVLSVHERARGALIWPNLWPHWRHVHTYFSTVRVPFQAHVWLSSVEHLERSNRIWNLSG